MSENQAVQKTRPSWIIWMHIAGTGYAVALWLFALSFFLPLVILYLGGISLTVATFAFIGGWGRYLDTKR